MPQKGHFANVNARDTGCLNATHAKWLIRPSVEELTQLRLCLDWLINLSKEKDLQPLSDCRCMLKGTSIASAV